MKKRVRDESAGQAESLLETTPKKLRSSDLFKHSSRVLIEHDGADYLLQITRQGKLILTK
ncbi:MAG: hemin uptake protein HemP [Candidatus Sedimenticola sp. 6PFRAG5]